MLFTLSLNSLAATYTWTGAINANWETNGNWDIAGSPGASGDIVIFNSGSVNCVVNSNINLGSGSITLNGYSGAITWSGDFQFQCGNATVTSGTLNFSGTTLLVNTTAVTVNGGTFIACAGPSFNGSGLFTVSSGSADFSNTTSATLSGLSITGGTFTSSSGSLTCSGNADLSGSGTFVNNNGEFTINSFSTTRTITGNFVFYGLTVNFNSGLDSQSRTVDLANDVTVKRTLKFNFSGTGNGKTLNFGTSSYVVNLTDNATVGANVDVTVAGGSVTAINVGPTINFNSNLSQTVSFFPTQNLKYGNIKLNNTATNGISLGAAVTSTNVTGNIMVETGLFDNGGFAIAGNAAATFLVNNGATFKLTLSSAFPTGFGTITLQPTSTVDYAGTGAQTILAQSYGNLISSSTGARTLSGIINIVGTYSITNFLSNYIVTGSTVNFNGTSAQTIPLPGTVNLYNNIKINTPSATLGALINLTNVLGSITVETGTFYNGGFAITGFPGSTFQVNNGATFNLTGTSSFPTGFGTTTLQTSSTVNYAGTAQAVSGTPIYHHLIISGSGTKTLAAALDVNGNFTISAGTFDAGGFLMNLGGDFTITSTFINGGAVIFDGAGAQAASGSAGFTNFTVNKSGGTLSVSGSPTYTNSGTVTLTAGTFNAGSSSILVGGNWNNNGATFTPGTSTVTLNGSAAQSILGGAPGNPVIENFYNLTINKSGGSTANISGTLTSISIGNQFYIQNNTFDGGTKTITLTGTAATFMIDATGSFTQGTSTIDFTGVGAHSFTGTGASHNFYNLSFAGTLTAPATLVIKGNLTSNSGSFVAGTNLVRFNGGGVQSVGGAAFTSANAFYNIEIGMLNTDLRFDTNIDLINRIDFLTTVTVDFDGSLSTKVFTLKSTGTMLSSGGNTAQIGNINGSTLSGNVTWERYIDGYTDWRMLACPISGSKVLDDWNDEIAMSGFTNTDDPGNSFKSVYTYTPGTGYVAATNAATDIISADANGGKAFYVYVGNTFPGKVMNPLKLMVSGPPINGNAVTTTLTYTVTDGFNLIANPYPAAIDFTGFRTSFNGSVNNVNYWTYDSQFGNYDVWDETLQQNTGGTAATYTTGNIGSGQGFWLQTTAVLPTCQFNESHKVTGTGDDNFLKKANPNSIVSNNYKYFHIMVSSAINPYKSGSIVAFGPWSDNFNGNEDAKKMQSASYMAPDISLYSPDGQELSISKMADLSQSISIPVKVKVGISGTYTISVPDLVNGPASCITLEDKLTGTITDLNVTNSYTFSISDTTKAPRFVLHLSSAAVAAFTASSTTVAPGTAVNFTNSSSGATSYSWNFGDASTSTASNPSHTYTAIGDYTVQLTAYNGTCGSNTTTEIIHVESPLGINSAIVNENVTILSNGSGLFVKLDFDHITNVVVEVFDVLGKNIHAQNFSGSNKLEQINMPAVGNGIYLVKVSTNNTTSTKRIFIGN